MRARRLAAAVLFAAALSRGVLAAERMTSASNDMARSVVGGGGGMNGAVSANNRLDGASSEEIGSSSVASANNRLGPGFIQIFAIPGTVTALTTLENMTHTNIELQWTVPGVDGPLGTLPPGSSYYIRVASYTVPDSFTLFSDANVQFSTSGTFPGTDVSSKVWSLIPNTTYSIKIWTKSPAGDLSYPMTFFSSGTTLAAPPGTLASTFLSLNFGSATVNWQALRLAPPDVSSASGEGYLLEASSTNFGALTPGGVVYSSRTPAVLLSTLTFSVLPDHLCVPHYFRVASLNWRSFPNYTLLGTGQAPLDYAVVVSTLDLDVGGIDINTSVVISTSLLVSNAACPVTYQLKVDAITPGTPWVAAASPGPDAFTVQALFNTDQPVSGAFTAGNELSNVPVSATATRFAADHTGMSVPVTEERLVWFKLKMPTFTSTDLSQQIRVTVIAVPPP
jgi:hypothetical protein